MKRDRLAAGRALGVPTRIVLLVALLAMAGACATPVGVTRQDPKVLYRALSKSVLSADAPSVFTEQLLRRRGLDDAFENNPEAMLAELHRTRTSRDSDRLFAVAELSFLHGRENNKREYVLAAEVTPIEGPEADRARKRIPPTTKVPITAFVRFDNVAEGLVDGQLRGAIELHAVDATSCDARCSSSRCRPSPAWYSSPRPIRGAFA
jgi:hypothetical protein